MTERITNDTPRHSSTERGNNRPEVLEASRNYPPQTRDILAQREGYKDLRELEEEKKNRSAS
jgi:hypothetical protein